MRTYKYFRELIFTLFSKWWHHGNFVSVHKCLNPYLLLWENNGISSKIFNLLKLVCIRHSSLYLEGPSLPFLWLGSMGVSIHMGLIQIRDTFAIVWTFVTIIRRMALNKVSQNIERGIIGVLKLKLRQIIS